MNKSPGKLCDILHLNLFHFVDRNTGIHMYTV